jgi:hypothetical protein
MTSLPMAIGLLLLALTPCGLRQISRITGGSFTQAGNAGDLSKGYESLGSKIGTKRVTRDVSSDFAAAGLVLCSADWGSGCAGAHGWRKPAHPMCNLPESWRYVGGCARDRWRQATTLVGASRGMSALRGRSAHPTR